MHCLTVAMAITFATSRPTSGHYQTLDLPKDAPRNQIKAHFYKLSKKYHPDVNSEPGAKEKFQAVSEAYAVLGDERKRRAYDRTLAPATAAGHASHDAHHAYTHWSYETRRRGATHAWEYARRPNTGGAARHSYAYPPPPGAPPGSSSSAHSAHANAKYAHNPQGARTNPFAHPHVQRATGRRGPLETGAGAGATGPATSDKVSMLGRAVTVAVLVFIMATIGHGASASAA
ncbi:DnaJ domain-containing protein [Trametes gibbosa]|nr:DnaJ domain-containing protein [Trametes gibbosa]